MNKKILISLSIMLIIIAGLVFIHFEYGSEGVGSSNQKTLVLGFDAQTPPYSYKDDNGAYVGFDIDLAQEVCKRNNWTLKLQVIDWDTKDTELNSGAVDCIWNGFTINGRENQYTWSKPYVNAKQVIVVRKDSDIQDYDDLNGKTVDVLKDSSALKALQGDQKSLTQTFKKLVQVEDINTGFMDLESGGCDAYAVDYQSAEYQIAQSNNSNFRILDGNISSEQYGVGFEKGNTELRDQVQKTLDEMYNDGTVERLSKKYTKYGVPDCLINYTNMSY